MANILVLHRDAPVIKTVTRCLSREGHVVMSTTNSTSISEFFPSNWSADFNADLLITGMKFGSGNPDGYEVVSHIRKLGISFPILVFTGGGGELPEGADSMLQMPVEAGVLEKEVDRLLSEAV